MEKMQKDFDSRAQAGPFPDLKTLYVEVKAEIQKNPGFEHFRLDLRYELQQLFLNSSVSRSCMFSWSLRMRMA